MASAVSSATDIPAPLIDAALANYPSSLRCSIADGTATEPAVPISEEVARGWLSAEIGSVSPSGSRVAVVLYAREACDTVAKVFVEEAGAWRLLPLAGSSTYQLRVECHGLLRSEPDTTFADVDGDGLAEIIINAPQRTPSNWPGSAYRTSIQILALRAGILTQMSRSDVEEVAAVLDQPRPYFCPYSYANIRPTKEFTSDTGVGFMNLDDDSALELLLYPDLKEELDEGGKYPSVWVPSTGTRVYKLVNGVYAFQYETPIGSMGMPAIGAAMSPAAVPASELEGVAKGKGGGSDQALAFYVMPPAKLSLDDIDWPTLRVGDFAIAATADRGVTAAPHAERGDPIGTAWGQMGQLMLLEDLPDKDWGKFKQDGKDPVIYGAARGALHMTTPFRELRFSKKAVFSWLWPRWQEKLYSADAKECRPQGSHQRCFTPLTLPIKASLKGRPGFALGQAQLWIETKE
jgi:hypothetical protein